MCAGAVALKMALHRDCRGPHFFVGLAGLVTYACQLNDDNTISQSVVFSSGGISPPNGLNHHSSVVLPFSPPDDIIGKYLVQG
jgi:hypothetical protein